MMTSMATADGLEAAVAAIHAGGLVAFPTETVYGLGADALDPVAVGRVFAAKGRPADHPLIVHCATAEQAFALALDVPEAARRLAAAHWPGPLTLVLARALSVPDAVTGGRDTVALRVPAHPLALALIARTGPLVGPSANRFGRVSPTRAEHVREELDGLVDVVLDGGPTDVGVESTVLDLTVDPPTILRPGGVSAEELEAVLGVPVERVARGPARAPGMLASHYAPHARVEVVEDGAAARARVEALARAGARVALLAPADLGAAAVVALEPAGAPAAYARVLYDRLREADRGGAEVVVVVPPPPEGVGVAVRDRLARAAHAAR